MQKIGCRLLCFIANADSCLCTLEHGKGQLDFFQNHVNRWWLPCLANICVCWLWSASQNEHQLSVRYFLAFGTRWSFCFSSFMSYWSSILRCSPHLCGKQSIVSVLLGRICFFLTTLFSQPPSFPLCTPHCYWEESTAFHLEGLWCKNRCPFSVCRVTCCCLCHHTSVMFIRNISGFTFSSLSRSTYCSNSLAVSHVWVMACDKQIHHAVDHFPFTSSQVINSCSGNHTKKLSFASSYPTVVLEVSTVFPWLRIHSICGNDVVMFGECGLFNCFNWRPGTMLAHQIAYVKTKLGHRWVQEKWFFRKN